jgi:hypothetical protein
MMIAALAGTTPAKNNAIKIRVASNARITSTRLASTFGGDASSRASRANSARWKSAIRAMVMISPTSATGPPSRANLV